MALPVHPRVCGEHWAAWPFAWPFAGSSPRVRGTRDATTKGLLKERFIPACAGNTAVAMRRWRCRAVHPRVCGEHERHAAATAYVAGSSPRVRGTPL